MENIFSKETVGDQVKVSIRAFNQRFYTEKIDARYDQCTLKDNFGTAMTNSE